jgi:hypothetical protein
MPALLLVLATLNTAQIPAHDCRSGEHLAKSPARSPGIKKLGDLPDANEIRAVYRTVSGCPMADVTRFHVSTPGGTVPGGVLVPIGGGRIDTDQHR